MSRYLLALMIAAFATSASAQSAAYPEAPLIEVADALQANDAQYFADHFAYIQTSDLAKISPAELLLATKECTLSDMQQGELGLADIRLSCPGRTGAASCHSGDLNLTILSRRDGDFAIEIAELRSGGQECSSIPPASRNEVSQ